MGGRRGLARRQGRSGRISGSPHPVPVSQDPRRGAGQCTRQRGKVKVGLVEDLHVCGWLSKEAQWGSPSRERQQIGGAPAQGEEGPLQAWQTKVRKGLGI